MAQHIWQKQLSYFSCVYLVEAVFAIEKTKKKKKSDQGFIPYLIIPLALMNICLEYSSLF